MDAVSHGTRGRLPGWLGCSRWLGREASLGHSLSLPRLLLVLSVSVTGKWLQPAE